MFVSDDPESLPLEYNEIVHQRRQHRMASGQSGRWSNTAKAIVNFLDSRYTESGTEVDSDELKEARVRECQPSRILRIEAAKIQASRSQETIPRCGSNMTQRGRMWGESAST